MTARQNQTFAVLGANGFIGYRLTEYLLLNDVAVPRPVVRSYRSMARVSRFNLDTRLSDALDIATLVRALVGCEVAFHCVVGDRKTILDSITSTYAACRQAGVRRLIYLSSAVVHGHNPSPGTDESSPLIRNQPFEYNVSKVLAESKLHSMMRDRAVECVILRPYIVYGPRAPYWSASLANDILARRAYLIEGGNGICNTIFIDNLVEAMILCATHPAASGKTFLIKDAERVTWRQLYAAVADAVGMDLSSIGLVSAAAAGELMVVPLSERVHNSVRAMAKSRPLRAAKELVRKVPGTISLARSLRAGLQPWKTGAAVRRQPLIKAFALDREIVSLQLCQYELPSRQLEEVVGYRPLVSFREGSQRTAEWLRFALGSGS
jgi:nucleoside-diphosphate-sugar epimerase